MICWGSTSWVCVFGTAWVVLVVSGTFAVVATDRTAGLFLDHEPTSWLEAFTVSVIVWALVGGAALFVALVGRSVGL